MKKMLSIALSLLLIMSLIGCATQSGNGGSGSSSNDSSNDSSKGSSEGESSASEPVTLKLTHQWPKATADEGDFRARLAVKFAEEVAKRTDGQVKIDIYPANSLVKSKEQYESMAKGATDMSVYPLDYAGGKVPAYGITLMPALIKNHEQVQAWETAEIGQKIDEIVEDNGFKILVWLWNAGAIGSKGDPIVSPDDVTDGMQMRAAGKLVEKMLASAGAGITSMSSSEMYSAFQTNILDAGVTSNSSFASYKLYEQVDSYTTSLENTFWFMFEPLLISEHGWNKLSTEQQKVLEEVAADLQPWVYEASKKDDERVAELFKENGVEVVDMDDESYQKWVELAEPIWDEFANNVEGGKELMELAKKVNSK